MQPEHVLAAGLPPGGRPGRFAEGLVIPSVSEAGREGSKQGRFKKSRSWSREMRRENKGINRSSRGSMRV